MYMITKHTMLLHKYSVCKVQQHCMFRNCVVHFFIFSARFIEYLYHVLTICDSDTYNKNITYILT